MSSSERDLLKKELREGLKQMTADPNLLQKILKSIGIKKISKSKRGGTVSRKRGSKIMQGYKAGGKV